MHIINYNKLHLKPKDFAHDVQYAKLNQLWKKYLPSHATSIPWGNARARRHSYHVLWIRRLLFRDVEDHQHRQQVFRLVTVHK